jgi:hypothetical protein
LILEVDKIQALVVNSGGIMAKKSTPEASVEAVKVLSISQNELRKDQAVRAEDCHGAAERTIHLYPACGGSR